MTSASASGGRGSAVDCRRVIEEQVAAINDHDAAGLARLYSQDASVRDPQSAEPLLGRDGVEQDASVFFTAFPDLRAEVSSTVVEGLTFAVELTLTGTHTGPLPLGADEVAATGRTLSFPMAYVSRLDDDGLIRDEQRYYDVASQLQQLGLLG